MSRPQDIRAVSLQFQNFIKRHESELTPGLDSSEEPGRIGFIAQAYRSLMSSFAQSKGMEMRKLLPDDFDSNEHLDSEVDELLQLVKALLAAEAG